MTQPALSLRLRQLSTQTGLKLFHRTARGLDLTPDGMTFHIKVMSVLNTLEDLNRTVRHMHDHVRGKLRIGTVVDPEFTRLGEFLSGLVHAAPLLEKELHQGMSGSVVNWIVHDHVDAGYYLGDLPVSAPDGQTPALVHKTLTGFSYRVIAPRGWESRVANKDWAALALLPWVGTVAESVHSRLLRKVYEPLRVTPNYVARVDQESSMLAMVRSGIGLSLCRDSVALTEMRCHGLAVVDSLELPCTLSFIALAERIKESGIACAFDVLNQIWSAQSATDLALVQRSP